MITDTHVDPLYGSRCEQALRTHGLDVVRITVPAGERSKDLKFVREIYTHAVEAGLDRSSVMVALGGGMVGDLTGFAAATFLRGIRFIQIPTTLLAMVDSSVGGKTGVNIEQGKNLVGAFHQPIEVVADLTTLKSLPNREYIAGMAEVIKYGVIWDAVLFGQIEANVQKLTDRDIEWLEQVIGRCCEIKAEVVAMDEREKGVRAILNFGHTIGHALEKISGYEACLHGEAVAAGMAFAGGLSVAEKGFPIEDHRRLLELLKQVGLPVQPSHLAKGKSWQEIREAMSTDKKARQRTPRFVLAQRMGSVVFDCEVTEELLKESWDRLLSSP
jgi:3-dehydroquinate synthase